MEHTPLDHQIGKFPHHPSIWTTGIVPPKQFVIHSYGFDEYIFFLDYDQLAHLRRWDIYNTFCHIIVAKCDDESSALFELQTDVLLNADAALHFGKLATCFASIGTNAKRPAWHLARC